MRSFRTLHLNTERQWRGGERQTLNLLVGLAERGHEAVLICPPGTPLEEKARAAQLTVHALPLRGELNPVASRRVRRVMRGHTFDICQMHTSHAHAIGVLARGWRRRPLTLVTRRVDFSIHRRGLFGLNRVKYRYGVDRYVAISCAIRKVMIQDGIPADRIDVVHSGVNPLPLPERQRAEIRAQLGIPAASIVIGNVAHLAQHKGQVVLIEAVAKLREQYPDAHVVIVGEGEERAGLEAAIARTGLVERCHLVGFQDDVAGFLSSFDLFVMPSLMEGLCTSILDALLARLPVVATNTGGIPEVIRDGETGLLAQTGCPHDLAAKIGELLGQPGKAQLLAKRGYERVTAEFSMDRMVEGTLEVYARMLAQDRV